MIRWLSKNFHVLGQAGEEFRLVCPKCGSSVFYFNTRKRLGHCHKASCNFSTNLVKLNRYAFTQFKDDAQGENNIDPSLDSRIQEITLPTSELLVSKANGKLMTRYENAVQQVAARGVGPEDQFRFKLTFNGIRVFIPIYYQSKLVNYIGRRAWWKDKQLEASGMRKYEYCKGVKTSNFIFNWDEMRLRERLTLVENTFNGIWLMNKCDGSTNFGSYLSATQIALIQVSRVKSVALLWDEGAEVRASRACKQLQDIGIPAAFIKMIGQPDNHPIEKLVEWSQVCHEKAKLGFTRVDL